MLFLARSTALPPPIPLRDSEQVRLILRPPLLRWLLARVLASRLDEVCLLVWVARLLALEVLRRRLVALASRLVVSLVGRRRVLLAVEDPLEGPVSFFSSLRPGVLKGLRQKC